jgi:hypothetical protein
MTTDDKPRKALRNIRAKLDSCRGRQVEAIIDDASKTQPSLHLSRDEAAVIRDTERDAIIAVLSRRLALYKPS